MPDTLDILAPVTITEADDRRKAAAAAEQRASFGDAYVSAFLETVPAAATRLIYESGFKPDPSFRLNEPLLKELTDGLDNDFVGQFGSAVSLDHARYIQASSLLAQDRRNVLASLGWRGQALQLGAAVADPTFLAAGGLGSVAALGKSGRLAGMVRAGLVTGVPFAALESIRAADSPSIDAIDVLTIGIGGAGLGAAMHGSAHLGRVARFGIGGGAQAGPTLLIDGVRAALSEKRDADDVLWFAAAQFIMGGILNAVPGRRVPPEVAEMDTALHAAGVNLQRDVELRTIADLRARAGTALTPKGEAHFAAQTDPKARLEKVTAGLREAIEADLEKGGPPKYAIGAATQNPQEFPNPPPPPARAFGDLDLSHVNDAPASFTYLGKLPISFGIAEQTSHSPVASVRRVANALGPDPLPKSDGSPSLYTAPEWKADKVQSHVTRVYTGIDALHGEHQRAARAAGRSPLSREEFNARVTRAVRRGGTDPDPVVQKAAAEAAEWTREVFETAQRMGVKGFDKFTHRDSYITRLWQADRIDAAVDRFGEAEVLRLLAQAVLARTPNLTPKQATTLAKAIIRNGGKVFDRSDVQRARLFAEDQSDTLAAVLKEVEPSLTDAQVEEIVYQVKPRDPESGTISRARRRIDLDETHRTTLTDQSGQVIDFGVEDLLENNLEVLQTLYARQVYGAAAMTEVFRVAKKAPDEVIDTIPQLLSRLEADLREFGETLPNGKLKPRAEHHLRNVEVMAKIAADIPLQENTQVRQALRIVRNLNTFRLMSNVGTGILNFLEVSEAVARAGARSVMRIVPELPQLFSRARSGHLSNEFLREVEWFVQGSERVARRVLPRAADDIGPIGLGRFEEASARAARFATDASLISWSQLAAQRITSLLIRERWTDLAFRGVKLSQKQLAEVGLTEPMADRIAGQLRTHATTENGVTGIQVRRTNMERWDDTEAASFFRAAMSKESRRLVLVNNPAAYARWMTTDMGKLISQFRTFTFGSWRNKLLFGVHQHSFETFLTLGVTTAASALGYVARTYIDSIGHPERRRFLRERLAEDRIITAAVARTSWSSFVPGAIDTIVSYFGGRKPIFQHGRTTGLSTGLVSGVPTLDWMNSAARAIGAAQAPFTSDYEFSRADVRNIRDALWVPNVVGLRNLIDQFARTLPSKSMRN